MKKIIISLIGILGVVHTTLAANSAVRAPASVDPANIMNATQQNLPTSMTSSGGLKIVNNPSSTPSGKTAINHIRLKQVKLIGIDHPVPDNVAAIYQKYIGQLVTCVDIQKIASAIQQQYRDDGYILVQVIIPPQEIDAKTARVIFRIVEGKIERVSFTGDNVKGATASLDRYAKPLATESPLSYGSLDRFILLSNDLPGINASATLTPDKKTTGAADLLVDIKRTKASGFVNINNRGTSYIGPTQATIGGSVYDIFGADAISGTIATALNNTHQMTYGNVSYDIVTGPYGTEINPSISKTHTEPGSGLSNFEMRGNSTKYNLAVNQPLYTATSKRFTLQSAFYRMNSSNKVYISEPLYNDEITALNIGLNYKGVFLNTYHDMSLSSTVGLPVNTLSSPSVAGAKSNFVHVNLTTSDIHYFTPNVSAAFGSAFQATPNTLVASEQIAYGGQTFGQGFVPYVISGDNGAMGSIALRYDLPIFGWLGSSVNTLQPQVFYDAGVVSFNHSDALTSNGAFGESAGVGLNLQLLNKFQVGLTLAKPLHITQTSNVSMGWQGFFNLTGTF